MITIDEFKKIEITVGEILEAEKVSETDKLLKLKVNFGLKPSSLKLEEGSPDRSQEENGLGNEDIRQIISGIAGYFPNEKDLVGKKCMFVTNLEPRIIRGLESQGMILALSTDDGRFALLYPSVDMPAGTKAK